MVWPYESDDLTVTVYAPGWRYECATLLPVAFASSPKLQRATVRPDHTSSGEAEKWSGLPTRPAAGMRSVRSRGPAPS